MKQTEQDFQADSDRKKSTARIGISKSRLWIHQGIAALLLVLWVPLGITLNPSWGWENHFFENSQLVIIALGGFASFHVSRQFGAGTKLRRFWLWSIGVWVLCFARELSWGRSFFPKTGWGEPPVFYTREELWFGPWIHPVVGFSAVIVLVGLLSNLDLKGLVRTVRIPLFLFLCAVLSVVLMTVFEHRWFSLTPERSMLLEEYSETIMWWSILGIVLSNIREVKKPASASSD